MPGLQQQRGSTQSPLSQRGGPAPQQRPQAGNQQRLEGLSAESKLPPTSRGGFATQVLKALGSATPAESLLQNGEPQRTATRAEAAMITARALDLGLALGGAPAVFSDVGLDHWAAAAIYRCQELGLFLGSNGKFMPDAPLSAAAATLVIGKVGHPDQRSPFDRNKEVDAANDRRGMPQAGGEKVQGPKTETGSVYKKHETMVGNAKEDLSFGPLKSEMAAFESNWNKNKARYEAVAAKTDMPAPLIAAIHWRESSGDFSTYLHQGDPLGRPAVHEPSNIPVFYKWEDAAVHALGTQAWIQKDLGMKKETTDLAAVATYAEHYNGLGYHNHDRVSPYVYSGTNQYQHGKYVADGHYSDSTKDEQLGVLTMFKHIQAPSAQQSTLVEGQVHQGKALSTQLSLSLQDSKQQVFKFTTTSGGFFHFSGQVAPGNATLSVGGKSQSVSITAGKPTWINVNLEDTQSPEVPATTQSPTQALPMPPPTAPPPVPTTSVSAPLTGDLASLIKGGRILGVGDEGPAIKEIQVLLGMGPGGQTGRYGETTEDAVKDFQKAHAIAETGKVGPQTYAAMKGSKTPILDQHRFDHERSGAFCGIATLAMTLQGNGLSAPTQSHADLEKLSAGIYIPGSGTSGSGMAQRMQDRGLKNARFGMDGSVSRLVSVLSQNKPVPMGVVSLSGIVDELPKPSARYPYLRKGDHHSHRFGGSGHWVTVVSFEGDPKNPRFFFVNDPDTGARLKMTRQELETSAAAHEGIWMISY